MLGDLQAVGGDTGEAALAMVCKQVGSLGKSLLPGSLCGFSSCPAISDDVSGESTCVPRAAEPERMGTHIEIFATTTDAGSDEAKARRLRQLMAKDYPHHLEFDGDCLAHQYQLIIAALLRFEDSAMSALGSSMKYWSTRL